MTSYDLCYDFGKFKRTIPSLLSQFQESESLFERSNRYIIFGNPPFMKWR